MICRLCREKVDPACIGAHIEREHPEVLKKG